MSRPAIGLICRPPRLARLRLEGVIGADRAFALAQAFLADSVALGQEVARRVAGDLTVFHSPADTGAEMAELLPGVALHSQAAAEIDLRRERAAAHLFARGAGQVVLIGLDAPTLPPAMIELLFDALRSGADAGCIPTLDGGYCAIGYARPLPGLTRGIPMNPELLSATRAKAKAEGLNFLQLQFWHDVDDASDLKLLRMTLDGAAPPNCSPLPPFAAHATRAVLG
ncbi:TIGR04282 family arsenosugar biosynthesis glycosyltransferase [Roseococcus sp.]|uniref:TIGR04282 family arsenosugar biosynthesis glycosyltransferase n=1 Tax=Roseococcus sp. TaxID=2109646 RepID=UPI003BACCD7C